MQDIDGVRTSSAIPMARQFSLYTARMSLHSSPSSLFPSSSSLFTSPSSKSPSFCCLFLFCSLLRNGRRAGSQEGKREERRRQRRTPELSLSSCERHVCRCAFDRQISTSTAIHLPIYLFFSYLHLPIYQRTNYHQTIRPYIHPSIYPTLSTVYRPLYPRIFIILSLDMTPSHEHTGVR